jgi:hypothetical protein
LERLGQVWTALERLEDFGMSYANFADERELFPPNGMPEDASGGTPDAATGTVALPKIETPIPQLLCQRTTPNIFEAGEHVGSPLEDFSRGEKKR